MHFHRHFNDSVNFDFHNKRASQQPKTIDIQDQQIKFPKLPVEIEYASQNLCQ